MKPNALRGTIAVLFLVAIIGAYLLGKSTGERQANSAQLASGRTSGNGSGGNGSLSGLGDGADRNHGAEDGATGSTKKPSVKSIIAKARAKMQGGMMNTSGMMRALSMLDGLDDDQLVAALEEVDRSIRDPQQKMMFGMMLLARWAESDGPAALAYTDEHFTSKNPMMAGMRMSVVSAWAQSDPEAAWNWYQKEDDSNQTSGIFGGKSMALMGIIASMANQDVDLAFDRLQSIEGVQERQMAIQGLGQAIWNEDKRGAILARIEDIEDPSEKSQMRSAVMTQWAMIDPEGALEWSANLEDGERSTVVKQIAQSLTWSDPQRAGELMLSEAKTPDERSSAYASSISTWAYNDPNGAGEWLAKQDQGADLDQARHQFSNSIAQKDPDSAMAWANAVKDEELRERAVKSVYMQWAGRDRDRAEAALSGSDLSAEKIEEIKAMEIPEVDTNTTLGVHFGAAAGGMIESTTTVFTEEATDEVTVPEMEATE